MQAARGSTMIASLNCHNRPLSLSSLHTALPITRTSNVHITRATFCPLRATHFGVWRRQATRRQLHVARRRRYENRRCENCPPAADSNIIEHCGECHCRISRLLRKMVRPMLPIRDRARNALVKRVEKAERYTRADISNAKRRLSNIREFILSHDREDFNTRR